MLLYTGILTKVEDLEDAIHPQNIAEGRAFKGDTRTLPTVSCPFILTEHNLKGIRTSTVQEIVSDEPDKIIFKTHNSKYVFTYTLS